MTVSTAVKATWVDIDALTLWHENYNQGDIGAILLSIQKFGFLNALRVWRDNTVMAGNHSLIALRQLVNGGWKPHGGAIRVNGDSVEVLIVDMSYLNQEQATAFAIADNRTASLAEPDDLVLVGLLQDLANSEDEGLLQASGYDGDDLDLMLSDLDGDFVARGETPQEALDTFLNHAIRQVVLYFAIDEYDAFLTSLHTYMSDNEIETHTDAVVRLLRDYETNTG